MAALSLQTGYVICALLLLVLVGGPAGASPPGDRGVRGTNTEPVLTPEQEVTMTRVNGLLNQLLNQIYKYGQRGKDQKKPPRRTTPAPDIDPRFGVDRPSPPARNNSVSVPITFTNNP